MTLSLAIVASPAVNPDDRGRPSPVLLRVYELRTGVTFSKLDYFSLERHDKTSLGQDLLGSEELVMRPGQNKELVRQLNADTGAVGIFVGYRDLGNADWRTVQTLPPAQEATWYRSLLGPRKVSLRVALDARGVTVKALD